VNDAPQGVQSPAMRELVRYRAGEYDFGRLEARLTALPQFKAQIDGLGYSLTDSPAGLASWILDHDSDAYEKIARAFVDGTPSGSLTRDAVLDNIALYWLTATGTSAARICHFAAWEEPELFADEMRAAFRSVR
jgi:hypothetical protein